VLDIHVAKAKRVPDHARVVDSLFTPIPLLSTAAFALSQSTMIVAFIDGWTEQ
jgi:hypothetical protein